jgi:hypothetical protein
LGVAEGFRGDVLAWVRIDGGKIARCHFARPVVVSVAAA